MVDAARLADELRDEQGIACGMDKERRLLECQLKDLQSRLDEAETNALKVRAIIIKALIEINVIYIFIDIIAGRKESHE